MDPHGTFGKSIKGTIIGKMNPLRRLCTGEMQKRTDLVMLFLRLYFLG